MRALTQPPTGLAKQYTISKLYVVLDFLGLIFCGKTSAIGQGETRNSGIAEWRNSGIAE